MAIIRLPKKPKNCFDCNLRDMTTCMLTGKTSSIDDYENNLKELYQQCLIKDEEKEIKIKIQLDKNAKMPKKAYENDACYDLYSCEYKKLNVGQQAIIDTGVYFELPKNREIQIRPRSSSFLERLEIIFGTIDSGYRKSIGIQVRNIGNMPCIINVGERIAQIKIAKIYKYKLILVDKINVDTERNINGFGSTGKF